MENWTYQEVQHCAWVLNQWFDSKYVAEALWKDTVGRFVVKGGNRDGV